MTSSEELIKRIIQNGRLKGKFNPSWDEVLDSYFQEMAEAVQNGEIVEIPHLGTVNRNQRGKIALDVDVKWINTKPT